jgi:hypothetical protein
VSDERQAKYEAALANLTEHLKNIDIACDAARLSAVERDQLEVRLGHVIGPFGLFNWSYKGSKTNSRKGNGGTAPKNCHWSAKNRGFIATTPVSSCVTTRGRRWRTSIMKKSPPVGRRQICSHATRRGE